MWYAPLDLGYRLLPGGLKLELELLELELLELELLELELLELERLEV